MAGRQSRQGAPKTAGEAARLTLIGSPGQAHRLALKFSDVGPGVETGGVVQAGQALYARPERDGDLRRPGVLRPS